VVIREVRCVKRHCKRISTRRVIFCYNPGHSDSEAREVDLKKIFREGEDNGWIACGTPVER
jgi:hypothetical protein